MNANYEIITNNGIQLSGLANINESLKTHYLIYRIDNIITNEFYIGQHKTNNVYDKYMGSGHILKCSMQHYDLSCFIKTILFDFSTEKEMDDKELELVPEISCHHNNPLCLNIVEGGGSRRMPGKSNPMYGINIKDKMPIDKWLEHNKKISKANSGKGNGMFGKKMKDIMGEDAYNKMRQNQYNSVLNRSANKRQEIHDKYSKRTQGKGNPAYGRKWMYNPSTNERIYVKGNEVEKYKKLGYVIGQNFKTNEGKRGMYLPGSTMKYKLIKESDIQKYLDLGYKFGRNPLYPKIK